MTDVGVSPALTDEKLTEVARLEQAARTYTLLKDTKLEKGYIISPQAIRDAREDFERRSEPSIVLALIARIRSLQAQHAKEREAGRQEGLRDWLPEVYKALEKLDAPNSLLALFGSVNDTLPEPECLELLREFNQTGSYMSNESASAQGENDG